MTIRLFYPASHLPHKNHHILASPCIQALLAEMNVAITLTIDQSDICVASPNISFLGRLTRSSCIQYLRDSSALLFLSSYESLGLPLIEAVEEHKPIICLDRPYSRDLLGDSAYYYSENSPESLSSAIKSFASEFPFSYSATLLQPKLPISKAWNLFIDAVK
jgi:glycosyltransferase involved in cell wall biosynthesis